MKFESEDIAKLGEMARISMSDTQVEAMQQEIAPILEYVSSVNEIVSEAGLTKAVGSLHNVFREDQVTNEPGSHTEALLAEMPSTQGKYLKVQKVIKTDD